MPFGVLVVPELNWMRPGSPGPMAAARRRTASAWGAPSASSRAQLGVADAPRSTGGTGARSSATSAAMSSASAAVEQSGLGQHAGDGRARSSRTRSSAVVENVERGTATPAGERDAEDRGDHLGAVAHDDGDPRGVADAPGDQAGGDRPGLALEVARRSTARWPRRGAGRRRRAPRARRGWRATSARNPPRVSAPMPLADSSGGPENVVIVGPRPRPRRGTTGPPPSRPTPRHGSGQSRRPARSAASGWGRGRT